MVNCKFFLEGYCKYGSRCRYDHVDTYGGYGSSDGRKSGTSILKETSTESHLTTRQEFRDHEYIQNVNQSFQHIYHQKATKYNVQEIIEVVTRDITLAEKGNQWQLSCYSPVKELPNIPELDDHSSEELRWECYKAYQNGTISLWQAIVQQLFANVVKINNKLKRKDTGYEIIDRWLREAEERNSQSNMTSIDSNSANLTAFGNNVAASSVFGGNSSPSPFFASNIVNSSMSGGNEFAGFGGGNMSAFGGNNFLSSFGGNNNFISPGFGGTNAAAEITSSPFSPQTLNQQESSFSFSLPQQSVTTQVRSGSDFGFGSQVSSTTHVIQSTQSFSTGISQTVDNQEYSKEEELTAEELEAFKANKFVFCSVPTKPPPRTLCSL